MKQILLIVYIVLFSLSSCKSDNHPDDIEFSMNKGLPIIKAELNGMDVYFLIDSGATSSVLNVGCAEVYGFSYRLLDGQVMSGINGDALVGHVSNAKVVINGTRIALRFKSVDLSSVNNRLNIVGLIGSDYLYRNEMIIDYKNKVLRKM